jgi:hypothetical protein
MGALFITYDGDCTVGVYFAYGFHCTYACGAGTDYDVFGI